jgi:C_GCAxxG_C_C family probable redox protein
MDRAQKSVEFFEEGFSCSQAVLAAFSESFGLDRKTALKLAQSFGGGMAHMGETCGAVTGAFMVIGLKHGRTKAEDSESKEKTYELVRSFVDKFRASNGSIICKELLGHDLNTEEGLKRAEEEKIFETLCVRLVKNASEILESLL